MNAIWDSSYKPIRAIVLLYLFKTKAPYYLNRLNQKLQNFDLSIIYLNSRIRVILPLFLIVVFLASCSSSENKLPIYGPKTLVGSDTVYSSIKPFEFINQDSVLVTEKTFQNKVYVADFIFLSCPTICPVMTHELKKVYDVFKMNPNVNFLSHSIDPEYDTVPKLNQYAKDLGVDNSKWHFVTGDRDSIFAIAEKSYLAAAFADSAAPGGYIHSGSFFLIDVNKHIRGVYDGTNPSETERLTKEINTLLAEEFN